MKNLIKTLLVVSSLFLLSCSQSVYAEQVTLAGALRQDPNDPTKWRFISDNYHKVLGFDPLVVSVADSRKIRLHYGKKYKQVVTLIVTTDEVFTTELKMNAGASVGLEYADIYLNGYYGLINPSEDLNLPSGNLWVYAVMMN